MRFNAVLFYLIAVSVFLGFSGCRKQKRDVVFDRQYAGELKKIREKEFVFMATNQVPGAAFAIAKEGKLIYSEGLGLASKDLNVPATRKTKFRIGQVSELFTSLMYHLMTEEGILHPDSTVQHYLPGFPEHRHKVKLRHLVNQTSGIREPRSDEKDWRGLNVSIQQGLLNFDKDSLVVEPGAMQLLSLFNYNLLGAIMEKVSEKHFYALLEEYITDTLELENTVVDHPLITVENRTDFFDYNLVAQVIHATFRDMRYKAPSEGLLSTAEDLVTLGNAILESEYISEEIREKLFEPVVLNDGTTSRMANGWMLLQTPAGIGARGRAGSVTGGAAALLLFPEEKLVVAGACNLSVQPEDIPVFDMALPFLPDPEDSKSNNVEQSSPKED